MNEFFFISVVLLFSFLVIFFIIFQVIEKLNEEKERNAKQTKDIQEIKERILLEYQAQGYLKDNIEKTRNLLEELAREDRVRKEKEREFSERIKRIDEIIAGTSAKGISGEKILIETFKNLPPDMIERNFNVKGKVVEFALLLPNKKRLPIDSKWPAGNLLLKLEKEKDTGERKKIIEEIEKETIRRIREVKQYIDPQTTWSQAIAAVPDSVYSVCSRAHLKANENDVILMPYSMVLPLLLYMYRLHLQYAISIDKENLQSQLRKMGRNLGEMEDILENKIARGNIMISNAYTEYKQKISEARSALEQLSTRSIKEKEKLEE